MQGRGRGSLRERVRGERLRGGPGEGGPRDSDRGPPSELRAALNLTRTELDWPPPLGRQVTAGAIIAAAAAQSLGRDRVGSSQGLAGPVQT